MFEFDVACFDCQAVQCRIQLWLAANYAKLTYKVSEIMTNSGPATTRVAHVEIQSTFFSLCNVIQLPSTSARSHVYTVIKLFSSFVILQHENDRSTRMLARID